MNGQSFERWFSSEPKAMKTLSPDIEFDYLLVGGGLQNILLALAILARKPSARLLLVERGERLGGNHTWCCHAADVPEDARAWFAPLVVARHAHYDVHFQALSRRLQEPYLVLTSERLHEVAEARLAAAPAAGWVRGDVVQSSCDGVVMSDGSRFRARLVIEARGPDVSMSDARHFQKFVGLELSVRPESVPEAPTLMDARVPQRDGFRFMYVVPLGPDRVLVEDTYYSESPGLDVPALEAGVLAHATQIGLDVSFVARREHGVLPLPLRSPAFARDEGPLRAGYAGGYFHPTTGYSLPFALALARHVASRQPERVLDAEFFAERRRLQRQQRYACWLNRLLFSGFSPEDRHHVLERFYALPEGTIRRFYALALTPLDRARILCGRPPRGFSARRLLRSRVPEAPRSFDAPSSRSNSSLEGHAP